jgi:hypothetical protein
MVLLGNPSSEHVGSHFQAAASELGMETIFVDVRDAFAGVYLKRKVDWWLRGRRPSRLGEMTSQVVRLCREQRPDLLFTTGFGPVTAAGIEEIRGLGVKCVNYLTDDPWNPIHRAPWFMEALPRYDAVFSPRRSNMSDLVAAGCRKVEYLPFAYAPQIHFPENLSESEMRRLESDVVFAGGGDADRVPYIGALRNAGFRIALYGGYWDRFSDTRGLSRGLADPGEIRKAMGAAKVGLCLVRRRNRDGHSMRSFEVPACGTCALAERTAEHEEIFGRDGETVRYFDNVPEMIEIAKYLVANEGPRKRLAAAARARLADGGHTYEDRLRLVLQSAGVRGIFKLPAGEMGTSSSGQRFL